MPRPLSILGHRPAPACAHVLLLILMACAPKTPEDVSSTGAAGVHRESEPPRADDPIPDPITHPCVVAAAQFDKALASADAGCQADTDCDCYPGGVTNKAGCGGVTSAAVAKELHRIAGEFNADGCDLVQQCAPQLCEPRCVKGSCR